MKILLTTLNATYMHTALSLRYLYSYCKKTFPNIVVQEYTINQHVNYILGEIYKGKYDIIGFSCYIWNISPILQLARNLKKINPHQIIILGGPEVSFDSVELMEAHPYIDYIVFGEGEETFKELLNCLINKNTELAHIKGITYRDKEGVRQNEARELIQNLDTIPSPFEEGIQQDERKIIYYESSRGCPYRCSYCISSTIKGVRFFSLERVKKDLSIFLEKRVRQVKFVDRTFNANKEHSLAIMKYLAEKDNGYTNFHFEMTGDRIDEEMLEFLSGVREGLFQFE
ncbi:MAG TPA: B12-binding domain-containing radical SAM protein, partial [Clostridiales bacterium]|nr:B12-binding domain-containing radical SAM protein [Clostridiales bacterium]